MEHDHNCNEVLVELTRVEGTQKKHAAWLTLLSIGAGAFLGLVVAFYPALDGKADAGSLMTVEARTGHVEAQQAGQAATLDALQRTQAETQLGLREINRKLDDLIKGLMRPRKEK